MKKKIKFADYKTGRTPWTQKRVDTDEQLTMYQYIVYCKYGVLAEDIKLEWIPTEYDEEGNLRLTGEIHTFTTKRTMRDILMFYPKIVAAWEGIGELAEKLDKKRARAYLSWSQMNLFEQSPEKYREAYFENGERFTNQAMEFGKEIAEVLEGKLEPRNKVEEYVKTFLSQYKRREYEIKVKSPCCPLLARLDGFEIIK